MSNGTQMRQIYPELIVQYVLDECTPDQKDLIEALAEEDAALQNEIFELRQGIQFFNSLNCPIPEKRVQDLLGKAEESPV